MKRFSRGLVTFIVLFVLAFGIAFAVCPLPGTIPVLMYHFIGDQQTALQEKNFVSRESFVRQMTFLHFFKYRVLTMDEFYETLNGQRKPLGREVLLTFDDGDNSFYQDAFPILKRYGFPSTIFAISESVKRQPSSSMSADVLKELIGTGLVTVGAHTKTHPRLTKMKDDEIEEEVAGSKQDLEEILGVPMNYFAYPFGEANGQVVASAEKAGYRLAFASAYGKMGGLEEGPYLVSRVKISHTSDNPIVFWSKVSGLYHTFKRERQKMRNRTAAV